MNRRQGEAAPAARHAAIPRPCRILMLALALLPCAPAAGSAQLPEASDSSPRFTLTGYTGVRAPFTGGFVGVETADQSFLVRQDRGGNALLGVEARVRLRGALSLAAAGVYSQSGEVHYFLSDTIFDQGPDWLATSSDAMWFARVGPSLRVEAPRELGAARARPSTDLTAGIAVAHEFGANHPALSVGFQGSLPVGRRAEFVLGLEDYLVFWRGDALEPAIAGTLRVFEPGVDAVALHYRTSNVLHLRIGLSVYP